MQKARQHIRYTKNIFYIKILKEGQEEKYANDQKTIYHLWREQRSYRIC